MGTATKKRTRRPKPAEPRSRGLTPGQVAGGAPPAAVARLLAQLEEDGAAPLGPFRDPVGGNWQVLAALPIEKVEPTAFQRDLSEPHVDRLRTVIEKLDRFLDPVIATRDEDGIYRTPNGGHRLAALRRLGARAVTALVVPEPEVAFRILALNTEKAHNLREKALEVIRMARALAPGARRDESGFTIEFEEPSYLTLGIAYERRGRFSGGAYHPVLRRSDAWMDEPLPRALEWREALAGRLLEVDDAVIAAVAALKERGLESPYLKAFVVARINPLRFSKSEPPPLPAVLDKMLASARRFDPAKIRADQVSRAGGPPDEPGTGT
jgi:ParB family chromosome partitioning protein